MSSLVRFAGRPVPSLWESSWDTPNRLFRMLEREFEPQVETDSFSPALDVIEDEKGYVIVVELPGVSKKDVHVNLDNGVLTLSGEKKLEKVEGKSEYQIVGRSYGSFSQSIRLGDAIEGAKAEAKFRDGLLSIRIPKSEAARPKEIPVRT